VLQASVHQYESSVVAQFKFFGLPVVLAAGLAALNPWAGLAGLATGVGVGLWQRKRARLGESVSLRVEGGSLSFGSGPAQIRGTVLRLEQVSDVYLDTKTIRMVQEGHSLVPAQRFIDTEVGPEVDRARVIVATHSGEELALTREYIAHMDAIQWLGKVRAFLRKQGWLPQDEQEESG
jgi:hypothetical protein